MTGDLVLTFVAPTKPLSANERAAKGHWAAKTARTRPWRTMAAWAACQAVRRADWVQVPVTVQVDLPFRDERRRDPHNFTSTTVKAIVDGLKDAKIIPDDTPEWATILDPTISVQPDRTVPLNATITIRPRSPA